MGTPFNTTAPASLVVPATDAQIMRALVPMLRDRDWASSEQTAYVERAAVLKLVIGWAVEPMTESTPPSVSRAIHNAVGRGAAYGERVNAILAYLVAAPDNIRHRASSAFWLYAPLTKEGASKLIEWLSGQQSALKAPAPNVDLPSAEVVPAGRYAIETNDGAVNALAFYKVDRPTEGRWAGYVFVKHIVGDDEKRMSGFASRSVLEAIAEVGAESASARYGHEIGECGICGRTLTNDESRARGIGPVCAAKAGW